MITFELIFYKTVDVLKDTDYFITGGIASGIWGVPRFTRNIDIVVFIKPDDVYYFLEEFKKAGFSVDVKTQEIQLKFEGTTRIRLGKLHVDLISGRTEFDKSAFDRRKVVEIFGKQVYVISAEDLLIYKIIAGREQDMVDITNIQNCQRDTLDRQYLKKWLEWAIHKLRIEGLRERIYTKFPELFY